jgi:2-dehydro-3-deoxyphosphogluconate aldolase / (4S)-4-hydroxy-2-oxoglutarate aldolase
VKAAGPAKALGNPVETGSASCQPVRVSCVASSIEVRDSSNVAAPSAVPGLFGHSAGSASTATILDRTPQTPRQPKANSLRIETHVKRLPPNAQKRELPVVFHGVLSYLQEAVSEHGLTGQQPLAAERRFTYHIREESEDPTMTDDRVFEKIARCGIVPVIAIESVDAAIPLADALLEGGLPLVEITFRTAAAAGAIEQITWHRPEVLVGAGTVVFADNLTAAQACGAKFAVAPGFNPDIVARAKQAGLPFVPGICTPSELEQALAAGCDVLKFFPSEPSGGIDMIKALAAPYGHLGVRLVPTGGVTMANLEAYLSLDVVLAVGGTWIAKKEDLAEGRWAEICDRCKRAVDVVAKLRG